MSGKLLNPLIAVLFVLAAATFILFSPVFHYFLPARQVEMSHGVQYGAVLKDFLFVQEITMKNRYLSGVDIYMAKLPSPNTNANVFVLIDDQDRILYTRRFSSADFGEALHFPFRFNKTFDIGKGKMVYACVYSTDGDQQSYIGLARKENSRFGKLYVMPILQGDVVQSFHDRKSVVEFTGSLGIKTYESDSVYFTTFRVILLILVLLTGAAIFFRDKVWGWIVHLRIRPDFAFGIVALLFGMTMLVITPPFQIPDEPAHFYRSYQVSELNLFKLTDNIPVSLKRMTDSCGRMQFSTHEKTSQREILALSGIPLDAGKRIYAESPNYVIPYIPQATGLLLGRLSGLEPLWLLYLGRFFNLLCSIALVFLAIRITPVFKWLFAMIGLLPMTLYQFASLSYDAGTISLSFLTLALILKISSDPDATGKGRITGWLFISSILLASSKPPYFLVVLLFLIIPVAHFGNLRRYIKIFALLLVTTLVVSQLWKPLRQIADRFTHPVEPTEMQYAGMMDFRIPEDPLSEARNLLLAFMPAPDESSGAVGGPEKKSDSPVADKTASVPDTVTQTTAAVAQPVSNPYNPAGQIRFILSNPLEYTGILFETLLKSGNLYIVSFIGLFGWIDTQVPDALAYIYLLALILLALASPAAGFRIGLRSKLLMAGVFAAIFVLIQTALYLYCNPVGSPYIIAVQGRYFIAAAPILFLLFYNRKFLQWSGNFKTKPVPAGKELHPAKKKITQSRNSRDRKQLPDPEKELRMGMAISLAVFLFGILTLAWSVYLILDRFYVLSA